MSLLKRVYDRMTGVLGRDCNGKPLRAGDRVVPTPPEGFQTGAKFRCVLVVVRSSECVPGWVVCKSPDGAQGQVAPNHVRRLDDPNDKSASWESVTELTGWTPRAIDQPSEVPA